MNEKRALVYLRRDLRLTDNTALNAAFSEGYNVTLVFVVDPRQIGKENAYQGTPALAFMHECLVAVDNELQGQGSGLSVLYGNPREELPRFAKEVGASALFYNLDYTPFSSRRDAEIEEALKAVDVLVYSFHDALLTPPGSIMTGNNEPYKVFTPFHRAAAFVSVRSPETITGRYFPLAAYNREGLLKLQNRIDSPVTRFVVGGRKGAEEQLARLFDLKNYETERDFPAKNGTAVLSPYLKFGVVSPREAYHAIQQALPKNHFPLTRQLYWRDFFTHIAFHMPHVFGNAFKREYDQVPWDYSEERFDRWATGTTGFPFVDAGMRQLNSVGWMHNRARMVTASFLTKDLHLDWRNGERYFATKLIDYDPAVNNGSWQWVSGTGADAQPWFRIFNPWLQQEKFDPEALYIKRYIPELKDVPPEDIHAWEKAHARHKETGYPAPMLSHKEEAEETKRRFKAGLS